MDLPVLALALALDWALGDPPNRFHPVAWLGRLMSWQERLGLRLGRRGQLAFGAFITLLDMALFAVPTYWLLGYLWATSSIGYIVVGALLLKASFSVRGLRKAALKIKGLLERRCLEEARFEVRALVSRDTSRLDEPGLASATIESVAENACDSFVAPIFYFLVFGVPGALAYRACNTLDAMIGYHGKYEYLGKFAARLDDVLNFVPARLTGLLLVGAALVRGRDGRGVWGTMTREHGRTESPNAGWPMSAMAGGLQVRLEKGGHYRLGEVYPPPQPSQIDQAVRLMGVAVALFSAVGIAAMVVRLAYFS